MTITNNKAVYIDYELTNNEGDVLDSSKGSHPLAYLHGHGNIIPGLESALSGMEKGDSLKVTVAPKDGYGERRDDLIQTVPLSQFDQPEHVKVGIRFHTGHGSSAVVTHVEDDMVTVDLNHPLSGETLHFDVTIVDVRDASEEELSHGHIHGEGGHHH